MASNGYQDSSGKITIRRLEGWSLKFTHCWPGVAFYATPSFFIIDFFDDILYVKYINSWRIFLWNIALANMEIKFQI